MCVCWGDRGITQRSMNLVWRRQAWEQYYCEKIQKVGSKLEAIKWRRR